MKELIKKETIEAAAKMIEQTTDLATKASAVIIDETIKLHIFLGILGVLKAAVVFIIFYVVFKYIKSLQIESNIAKSMKTTALIASLIYFTFHAVPHLADIGKAVVAPNLFLIEKGVNLIKGN